MSLLRQAFGLETRSQLPALPDVQGYGPPNGYWWGDGMVIRGDGGRSVVSVDRAMRLSAVFACLRLLSEAVATLPLDVFYRQNGDRKPYRPRPDYLSFDPPQHPRTDYMSQLMLSLLTDGNAFVLTPRDELGVPTNLIVLDPALVTVQRLQGVVTYECQGVRLDPLFDIMHIKGMCLPGAVRGLSPIAYARETISLGLAAQEFGESFLTNSAQPGGVIEMPEENQAPADAHAKAQRIAATWNSTHQGQGNAGKVGVLIGGATFRPITVNPNDAQFLETRQFQIPDVARIFGVPPHLIADASNSTSWGSGLAEQNLAFGQFSLRPWIERIEEGHSRLLTTHGLKTAFVKLNLDALLRASLKDRYDAYAIGIENRIDTINEVRRLEDKPPVPWGDQPFVPERVTETVTPGVAPTDPAAMPPVAPVGGKP
jgi:HK97 family phage portal protein